MKITHLNSATEIIEVNGVKILTDPWLDDGIYYGSWYTYPPYDSKNNRLIKDIDYIQISHIHPDHFCEKTLAKIDKSIPVLILNYAEKFVLKKLERLGFENIIELDHNKRTLLKNGVYINIIAADNCNPEICGHAFGCFFNDNKSGKTYQIDSMSVIDNGEYTLLNTNDCPYPLAHESVNLIQEKYKKIDFMLVGYSAASLYPFVMKDYSDKEMNVAKKNTKIKCLNFAFNFIKDLKPKHYMPFAGSYVLGGKNWELNKFSPIPNLDEARDYLDSKLEKLATSSKCILINSGESFDIKNLSQTKKYTPIDENEKLNYLKNSLSLKKFDYESTSNKSIKDLLELIEPAFKRFKDKVKQIGFKTDTKIIITLSPAKYLVIDMSQLIPVYNFSNSYEKITKPNILFELDNRLLFDVLRGPRYAHWNNVEIGSLMRMKRNPDVYEQGIHLSLCYLHV